MILLTSNQAKRIIKSVVKCITSGDMRHLTKAAYNYINLCAGFIAHYDRGGFQAYYSENSLKADLVRQQAMNQWENFSPKDKDYDYYMQKKRIYNDIIAQIGVEEQLEFDFK